MRPRSARERHLAASQRSRLSYWHARGATSDASAVGSALRCPPNLKMWVGNDSTLRMYAVDTEGKHTGGTWNTPVNKIKDKCWSYDIESIIVPGATLK